MEKSLNYLAIVISIFVTVVIVAGYLVGNKFSFTNEFIVDYDRDFVWMTLNDIENIPLGKKDVKNIEVLGKYLDLYMWRETLNNDGFRIFKHLEKIENEKMVVEMTDSSYGVTGVFEIYLSDSGDRTVVKIIEKSQYDSIIRRGVLFFFGLDKESKDWMKFLRVRLWGNLLLTP